MFGHQDDQQTVTGQDISTPLIQENEWPSEIKPEESKTNQEIDPALTSATQTKINTLEQTDVEQTSVAANDSVSAPSELLVIKQQALSQLSPIIDHLEQTPEEKFRTTMMMIQASDDQSLIKAAYEAAQQIGNDKDKAQALLDIVNEINYFTHQGQEN